MLCEAENKSESIYLNIFKNAYDEADFRTIYEQKGVLCMHHFKHLSSAMKRHPHKNHFESVTLERLGDLLHELKEIKRKNDHRAAHERLTKWQQKIWQSVRKLLIDQGEHRR